MLRRAGAFLLLGSLIGSPACFGGSSNTTESGLGKPVVSLEIPEEVTAGATEEVTIKVTNPGPGDIDSLAVAFALVGPVQSDGSLPTAIVGPGGEDPVVSTEPEAAGVSENGSVYVFRDTGGAPVLPDGDEFSVIFTLRMPETTGVAANSVQVYDGNEVDRADGARLETMIVE